MWSILELLRKNPEVLSDSLKKRFMDPALVDKAIKIDKEWRALLTKVNELRHMHNVISSQIPRTPPEERPKKIEEARRLLKTIEDYEH
ncbi:MAG: serine--tRNA ligase, partial [Thermoprotei archaeon]